MEDHKIVQRNLELQRQWYGEPLGDRVRRLVVAFDVSQANLADVLGISAPMLSQVMSGRRHQARPEALKEEQVGEEADQRQHNHHRIEDADRGPLAERELQRGNRSGEQGLE